ncbi:MAG: polyprenyl synthetase family protein [Planctomycetes bacterium]|nr:polyprenyl synthetase family protein [Planctomycetota bacterium]
MSAEASAILKNLYAPILDEIRLLERFLEEEFALEEPFILQLIQYIGRFRGKQIRPALLLMIGKLGGGEVTGEHVKIAAVIEMIHSATLVHDDILDSAALRRNVETLHRRWGERVAVLMGDFIYSRAFALSTEVPGMAQVLSQTTNTICDGELLQIRHRFLPDMGEEIYFKIIFKKTAILYAVACELGGCLSRFDPEDCRKLRQFGLDLGMAFQIVDDCMDYAGDEKVVGKSLGTDLHQGKVTLPLLYYFKSLQGQAKAAALKEALRKPLSAALEKEIAREVREEGALQSAFQRAEEFIQSAKSTITGFPTCLRECLEQVSDYVLRRRH